MKEKINIKIEIIAFLILVFFFFIITGQSSSINNNVEETNKEPLQVVSADVIDFEDYTNKFMQGKALAADYFKETFLPDFDVEIISNLIICSQEVENISYVEKPNLETISLVSEYIEEGEILSGKHILCMIQYKDSAGNVLKEYQIDGLGLIE